jgi:hypothetical protein
LQGNVGNVKSFGGDRGVRDSDCHRDVESIED